MYFLLGSLNLTHREELQKWHSSLVNNMNLKGMLVLDELYSKSILDNDELEEIRSASTHTSMNGKLLSLICRSSSEQYIVFLDVLRRNDQGHLIPGNSYSNQVQ